MKGIQSALILFPFLFVGALACRSSKDDDREPVLQGHRVIDKQSTDKNQLRINRLRFSRALNLQSRLIRDLRDKPSGIWIPMILTENMKREKLR